MKTQFKSLALVAILAVSASFPGYAEDAAKSVDTTAPAAAAPAQKTDAPASVPRPSILPKSADAPKTAVAPKVAEPAAAPERTEAAPRRYHRYARHHYRRYAYWEPFPVYFPRMHRHRIYWNRIPWFFF